MTSFQQQSNSHRQRGYTLVEIIIGMIVIAVIASVLASVISISMKTMQNIRVRKEIVIDGSTSTGRLTRELNAYLDLQVIQSNALRFRYRQSQAAANDTLTAQYSIANGILTRQIIGVGSPRVVTPNVVMGSSGFEYYDAGNNPTTVPADVKRIRLNLMLANQNQSVLFTADVAMN